MRLAWLLGVSAVVIACSSKEAAKHEEGNASVGATAQAIQGGTTDSTNKFRFAVGVCIGSNCNGICSGALIAPNVVVTARHCVNDIDYNNTDPNDERIDCTKTPTFTTSKGPFSITTDYRMYQSPSGAFHSVKKVVVPTDNTVCKHDIALLVLNDVIDASEAKPIIPGVQYPINYSKYLSSFTAIGYGATGPEGIANDPGTRHYRELIEIQCIPGDPDRDCPPGFETGEFIAGDGTCGGDSGSSAFEAGNYINGVFISFGVLSRGGTSMDGQTCEGSIYTRLDQWRDLVISTVQSASNNWTLYSKPNPDWTIYVPPEAKDGGTPAEAGPTTTPKGKGFGEDCGDNAECTSNQCVGNICTRACDEANVCPDGYECKDALCAAAASGDPGGGSTTTTTESGCSSAPGTPAPWGTLLLTCAVVGLSLRRRRVQNA